MSEPRHHEVDGSDRRVAPRIPFHAEVRVEFPNFAGFVHRFAANLSVGGLFLELPEPPAVGTRLRFEFQLPDQTALIRGEGEVMWRRERGGPGKPLSGVGVRFVEIDPTSRELIYRTVDRFIQSGGQPFDWSSAS